MVARRYTLRLHRGVVAAVQGDANIDPQDHRALRDKLEEMVEAHTGTLNLDLSRWWLRVHRFGGGMVVATVRVDRSGRTVVRR